MKCELIMAYYGGQVHVAAVIVALAAILHIATLIYRGWK
jgi:hypothetical protein